MAFGTPIVIIWIWFTNHSAFTLWCSDTMSETWFTTWWTSQYSFMYFLCHFLFGPFCTRTYSIGLHQLIIDRFYFSQSRWILCLAHGLQWCKRHCCRYALLGRWLCLPAESCCCFWLLTEGFPGFQWLWRFLFVQEVLSKPVAFYMNEWSKSWFQKVFHECWWEELGPK